MPTFEAIADYVAEHAKPGDLVLTCLLYTSNMGAGRVVYQELTRITKSIEDGDFFENQALTGAIDHCLQKGTALHLIGLLSDGGVHSHNSHLYAIL